jgi:hypothetical protein
MITENLTQKLAVVGAISPGTSATATGSNYTESIDASIFPRLVAYVIVGGLAGAGTVNVRFQHCSGSLSSDSAWADVNSACVTSTYVSGANGSVGELELRLDQNPSVSRYVRAESVGATSTWNGAVLVVGVPTFHPGRDVDSAIVKEIVVY